MTLHFNKSESKTARRKLPAGMPAAEVMLWSKIKGRKLLGCKFRRQYGIDQYTLDFYSPEIKLAVELDGASHYRAGGQDFDRRRDATIRSFGIRVIRILNGDVYDKPGWRVGMYLSGSLRAPRRTGHLKSCGTTHAGAD